MGKIARYTTSAGLMATGGVLMGALLVPATALAATPTHIAAPTMEMVCEYKGSVTSHGQTTQVYVCHES